MWVVERMEEPPRMVAAAPPPTALATHSTRRSLETLVVVLAVITIVAVLAGVLARVCGGRHMAGGAEHDIEGWVESKCRSCIDGGLPAPQPQGPKEAAAGDAKK